MKSILISVIFMVNAVALFSQESCSGILIDFESNNGYVKIDNENQLWQIGKVNKTIFDSSYKGDAVIVTDTANTYGSSIKSYFQIKSTNDGIDNQTTLSFYHRYHTDTIADFGYVMCSLDGGENWLLCHDTAFQYSSSCGPYAEIGQFRQYLEWPHRSTSLVEPFFSGNEISWVREVYQFSWWHASKKGSKDDPDPCSADSILFRFYFESDSLDKAKDGWMIDNIEVKWDFSGDLERISYPLVRAYPNPFDRFIYVSAGNFERLEIVDITGVLLMSYNIEGPDTFEINTEKLERGVYILRLISSQNESYSKLITKN